MANQSRSRWRRARGRAGQVGARDDADQPMLVVEHGQSLHAVPLQQAQCVRHRGGRRHRHHRGRHDVRARERVEGAGIRLLLHFLQQRGQVFGVDVEPLALAPQCGEHVRAGQPARRRCMLGGRPAMGMRIPVPGRGVVRDRGHQQQRRLHGHRLQHEAIAQRMDRRPPDDRCQRHRARGRMHAAQREHAADGQRHRQRGRQHRIPDHPRAGHAHYRCHQVAADDGPRLRQRAGRYGEQQHRRSAHRRYQQGNGHRAVRHAVHRRAGEQDADQRAGRRAQALGPADSHGSRGEAGEPAQQGKAVHDGFGGWRRSPAQASP